MTEKPTRMESSRQAKTWGWWLVWVCAVALLLGLSSSGLAQKVGGQVDSSDVGKAVQDTSCFKLRLQALRDATDPGQADRQEWNLRTAQAYGDLALAGVSC